MQSNNEYKLFRSVRKGNSTKPKLLLSGRKEHSGN